MRLCFVRLVISVSIICFQLLVIIIFCFICFICFIFLFCFVGCRLACDQVPGMWVLSIFESLAAQVFCFFFCLFFFYLCFCGECGAAMRRDQYYISIICFQLLVIIFVLFCFVSLCCWARLYPWAETLLTTVIFILRHTSY